MESDPIKTQLKRLANFTFWMIAVSLIMAAMAGFVVAIVLLVTGHSFGL